MTQVEELKNEVIRLWSKEPAVELCLTIIDRVVSYTPRQSAMLTFGSLCQMVGKAVPDTDLLTAITILAGSKIQALDARALFVDEQKNEHELDPEELREAKRSGSLVHPVSGALVDNYEASLIPFFVPSSKLLQLTNAQRG